MRFTLALVAVLAASAVLADSGFDAWSKKHNKVYGSWSERQYREASLLNIMIAVLCPFNLVSGLFQNQEC